MHVFGRITNENQQKDLGYSTSEMIQALFIEYLAVWGVIKVNNSDRNNLTFFKEYGKTTKMNQSLKLVTCDRFKGFTVLSMIFFYT